jgi:hypothetical protein
MLKFKYKKLGLISMKNRLNRLESQTFFNLRSYSKSLIWLLPESFTKVAIEYFSSWSLSQWVLSLSLLTLVYALVGIVYNKAAKRWFKGYWLSWRARGWLILFDIGLNILCGMLIVAYPDLSGSELLEMIKLCPIFLSPFILGIEMILFIIYTKRQIAAKKLKEKELQREINQKLNEKKWKI